MKSRRLRKRANILSHILTYSYLWTLPLDMSEIKSKSPKRRKHQECPEILAIQLAASSEIQERMMILLKEGGVNKRGSCSFSETQHGKKTNNADSSRKPIIIENPDLGCGNGPGDLNRI